MSSRSYVERLIWRKRWRKEEGKGERVRKGGRKVREKEGRIKKKGKRKKNLKTVLCISEKNTKKIRRYSLHFYLPQFMVL